MPASDPSAERVVELESLVMHLQSDVEALNAVVLKMQTELDTLKSSFGDLDQRLSSALDVEEAPDPRDERPPHY